MIGFFNWMLLLNLGAFRVHGLAIVVTGLVV